MILALQASELSTLNQVSGFRFREKMNAEAYSYELILYIQFIIVFF
jgi:hypothetical protein